MPLRPRSLYGGLLATSLVVTGALLWSGWRLVTQQRELDARQARQTVEAAADALASDIREALAEQGDRLRARLGGAAGPPPPSGGALVTWRADHDGHLSSGGLPFVPWAAAASSRAGVFARGEAAEFTQRALDVAERRYRSLAEHADPMVRAGALLRLARVLRTRGDNPGAIAASSALEALGAHDAGGIPAALAGLDGQRLALVQLGDVHGAGRVAEDIRQRLDVGAWPLDRGTAEFYRDEVSDAPRPEAWQLAAAVSDVWHAQGGPLLPSRGLTMVERGGRPVLVAWRANAGVVALEAAFADRLLSSVARHDIEWRLADSDDHRVAGATVAPEASPVDRVIGGGSSWTVRAWPSPDQAMAGASREPLLIAATAGTVLFVWSAAGLMARALTREARVAQLQTDFVAAVSHEFRSPLTTMRQMAEMLDTDRVPDEARRRQYYHVLAGETTRLQALVERLLDFGRMEAGHDQMRREHVDVAALVRSIVDEMRQSATERGGHVEVVPAGATVLVEGDVQSLRLAIRNLVENAIKYSPESPDVTIRLDVGQGRASIAVTDRGLGIDRDEQRAIFGKFVRGRAATATRVRGTGVGLAAVKHVVDAHGGRITLESEPGRGSTFVVWLPMARAVVEDPLSTAEGSEA